MKIIDVHVHTNEWRRNPVSWTSKVHLKDLLEEMRKNSVEKAVMISSQTDRCQTTSSSSVLQSRKNITIKYSTTMRGRFSGFDMRKPHP